MVTVGASTSAVLAMIAGYGIADRADGTQPTLGNDDGTMPTVSPVVGPPTAPSPPNAVASTIPSTEPPRVIVVYVDARTGQPIPDPLSPVGPVEQDVAASTSVDAHPGDRTAATGGPVTDAAIATDGAAAGHATTPAEVEQPATADPVPVEAPTAVDLAVPAPPPPTVVNQAPAPASAPAPAPAPEPSGESGGS